MAAESADKHLGKRSLLSVTGKMLRLAAQVSVVILYARKLSFEDYGTYQSVWLFVNVLSVAGLFGLPSLLLSGSYLHIKEWIALNKSRVVMAACVLNIIPAVIFFIVTNGLSFQGKILVVLLLIAQNISIINEAIALKKGNDVVVLISNIFFSIGYFAAHIYFLWATYSLEKLLIWLLIINVIKTIIVAVSTVNTSFPDSVQVKSMGKQWLFLGMNELLNVLALWLDKWLVLLFLPIAQFAIYYNGAYEVPVFALMLSAVGNIMLIEFSNTKEDSDTKIRSLFMQSSMMLGAIVFPAMCFLLFYHAEFFTLIFGNKYADSIPIFFISILILPIRITNSTMVLQVYGRSDLIIKGAIIDLIIAVLLMLILYPMLGMKGLALAFVISSYLQFSFYLWQTSRLINKKIAWFFPLKDILKLLLFSAVPVAAIYFSFKFLSPVIRLIPGVLITLLLSGYFLWSQLKKKNADQH